MSARNSRLTPIAIAQVVSCALMALMPRPAMPGTVDRPSAPPTSAQAAIDFTTYQANRGHSIGNIGVGVNNYGEMNDGWYTCSTQRLGNVQYPLGSRCEWIGGFLWVGGVRDGDTLVSCGGSPWSFQTEYFPTISDVRERASRNMRGQLCFDNFLSDSAKSDYDVTIWLADTLADPQLVPSDPYEGRPHRPLGIVVKQTSYSWSSGSGGNFVIIEFEVSHAKTGKLHIGDLEEPTLRDMYLGLFDYAIARYPRDPLFSTSDNLVEYVGMAPSPLRPGVTEGFNTVFIADNDGDPGGPLGPGFNRWSVPDVVGLSILGKPTESSGISFNWFAPALPATWGPVRRQSHVVFPDGGLGEPLGDRSAYMIMSNGEIDYPQVEAAIDHSQHGWLPPIADPAEATRVASGAQTSFVLSVGPFDLPPDSTATVAIAIVGGRDYHKDPNNFQNFFDPFNPAFYHSRLDPTDLLRNVQLAKWTYDNPGIDTDGDGYAGDWYLRGQDTVYYRGDGVPDIRASLPPAPPTVRYETAANRIRLIWNGLRTETEKDVFTARADFEGYRVYLSRTGNVDDWQFLTQRDVVDYARYTWNSGRGRWQLLDPPIILDSLKRLYDTLTLERYGYPFSVDSFKVADVDRALIEVHFDPDDPTRVDTVYRYFARFDANNWPDDKELDAAAVQGLDVTGVIRKVYPDSAADAIAYRDNGEPFAPFFEYEYVIKDLLPSEPVFLAVTAYDNGDPASGLLPLESGKTTTKQEIWPINSAAVVASERPKPGVYPNPYRLCDYYNAAGWENPRGQEPDPERARKVTFTNVPDTCTVSIWSIDGDLVRKLEHRADPSSSEATVVVWNLITRNTQAVKTGIYIWSVESRLGTDVGKLVIVK